MQIGPGTRLNEYEVVSPLGKGGMGEVFLARDTRLDRPAALKILRWESEADAERVRRFAVEAKAAAALTHPNVATVYGIGQCGAICFIAMEFVKGETLREAKLDLVTVVDVALQAAAALEAAHAVGIVHRDIKPANIMRTAGGLVKVLDFGLAKRIQTAAMPLQPGLTEAGLVMGTLGYMSPEQLMGRAIDHRSDIFSLGVVLFELLSGKLPFAAHSYECALHELTGVAAPLQVPKAPPAVVAALLRCLDRDPARRFQSAAEFAAALKAAASAPVTPPAPSPIRSSRRDWVLAGVATVAGAGGAAWRFTNADSGPIDSLAVLPFGGGKPESDIEYLREGIAESLMNRLSGLDGIRVVSRDSAFRHRGQTANEAGRKLGVRGVIAGAIHQVEGALLVTAELVDASRDQRLWGDEFRCDGSDILGTRDQIADKIAGHLRLKLTGAAAGKVEDPRAHDLYLRGRFLVNRLEADDIRRGLDYLKQAVEIDANCALAHAAAAEAHLALADLHQPSLEVLPAARDAARRALQIDPDLADAHVASAIVQAQGDLDWAGAEASLRRAISISPHCPQAHGWLGWLLSATGRRDEGLAASRKAVELEPRSPLAHSWLAANLYFARRYAEAFAAAGQALDVDPRFHLALYWWALAMVSRGLPAAVTSKLESLGESNLPPVVIAALGRARAARGQIEKARQSLELLEQAAQERHVSATLFSCLHAALGNRDSALGWLERACDTRARLLLWTRADPVYVGLHAEPRFQALLAKLKL